MILNRKSPDVFKDVAEFFEIAQPDMLVPEGQYPSDKAIELALSLIHEECNEEYIPALKAYHQNATRENLIAVVDGGMDCIYVIAWAMRLLNVPSQAMWNEVQRSNMAKFQLTGADKPIEPLNLPKEMCDLQVRHGRWVITNRETGKVVKPKGWTQPDLFKVLEEHDTIRNFRTMPDITMTGNFLHDYVEHMESRRESGNIDI